ncbi:glycosyltransferase-like domain-containing protein 1 isoform X4 [Acanthopagrus latus]|uniref:glycosyltransferase-like domain-containing protein 1 isoform X4 n=1 Tax=Acanthopagrus latus TaxID=8177 RepID=UPI00187C3211|nr:glycosyltransferase-like domain-containing protein 1 isoform X4 [Acanthopagrus latus]
MQSESSAAPSVLLVEAFYGGSHKQLIDLLQENISCSVCTLPAKKWHWRARTAALHFSQTIPTCPSHRVLFCSSVLNLCELVALRPDLARLKKVLYFHENQLVYPVRKDQERDFQLLPEHKLICRSHVDDIITPQDEQEAPRLLSSPDESLTVSCEQQDPHQTTTAEPRTDPRPVSEGDPEDQRRPLHIVWPHRWEHDKDPELFFSTLIKLKERRLDFHLSVLGETFTDPPEIFPEARRLLDRHILNWGFLPSKDDYLKVLCEADVVVSTARHEFFGVAMLEAVHCGCYPLCPKALVYPEIFPAEYLYSTPEQLCKRLQSLCRRPDVARRHVVKVDTSSFSWSSLKERYETLLAAQRP